MRRPGSGKEPRLFRAWDVRWIVDRLHVSVSEYAVLRDFAKRTRSWDGVRFQTPGGALLPARRARLSAVRLAVAYHRENQRLYLDVIGGRTGRGGTK